MKWVRYGAYLAVAGGILFMLAALALALSGWQRNVFPADMLIVPGNRIEANGEPHPRLAARLQAALKLYQANTAPLIFVSGGRGLEGFDEAVVMARYLRERGVPDSALIIDLEGVTTRATARNAAVYMRAHSLTSAIMVTQFFHIPRSLLAMRQEGICKVGGQYADYYEGRDFYSLAREVVGYPAYAAKQPLTPCGFF